MKILILILAMFVTSAIAHAEDRPPGDLPVFCQPPSNPTSCEPVTLLDTSPDTNPVDLNGDGVAELPSNNCQCVALTREGDDHPTGHRCCKFWVVGRFGGYWKVLCWPDPAQCPLNTCGPFVLGRD